MRGPVAYDIRFAAKERKGKVHSVAGRGGCGTMYVLGLFYASHVSMLWYGSSHSLCYDFYIERRRRSREERGF